jgi:hypothetical protein
MAIFKNTTVSGTGYITPPVGNFIQRPTIITTTIQWTNTGSQAYSVLTGITPTLSNTSWTAPTGVTQIEVLVVAGGGPGNDSGGVGGGGGGAGGLIYNSAFAVTPGNSYTVTVGAGGVGATTKSLGSNSIFGSLTAIGGGVGAGTGSYTKNGGSGGGSGAGSPYITAGTGTAGQGFDGGTVIGTSAGTTNGEFTGGGGGGAGSAGVNQGGGIGLNFSISGAPTWYAGGGGGARNTWQGPSWGGGPGNGGLGGGGAGGDRTAVSTFPSPTAGTASTGGGGGGSVNSGAGANGGSGIVIIRYTVASDTTNPTASIRYNTDVRKLEIYESSIKEWVPQDSATNYGGHNLLTYSEQFDNSAWAKTNITVTANSVIAPDGTLTADTIATSSTATSYIRYDTAAQGTSVFITVSAYAKSATSSTVTISDGYGTGANATFNLSTGAIVQSSDGGYGYSNPGIISVGNGWWRIWQTFKTQPSNNYPIGHRLDPGRTYGGTGSVGDSVYVWGAQVEKAYTPGPYTRTVDQISPIPTELGGYRLHTYTTVGTSGFTPACTGFVEVLVVAGGGSGPSNNGGGAGGGGGGGVIYSNSYQVIANTRYTVTVGAGGAAISGAFVGNNGGISQFGSLVAVGGGGGGNNTQPGRAGGSGGGSGEYAITNSIGYGGGYVPNQGFPGGYTTFTGGCGGGGGAGGPGTNCAGAGSAGQGGPGVMYSISGKETYYGGGGGSSVNGGAGGAGGIGGGGNGGAGSGGSGTVTSGTANTGGGGGGTYQSGAGTASGGSGIVIVRYRYD